MFTTRPELVGTFGMVSSTHWLASQTGMAVLERGGNAFDAAVASGFVLQVVEPHLNGPGGDVSVIGWSSAVGAPFVVCGQGAAPRSASIQEFRKLDLDYVPGTGLLAACIPGQFGAWLTLLSQYGTMPLAEVLRYAIGYARNGFPILPGTASTIETMAEHFSNHWPTSAELWLAQGHPPQAGALYKNEVLAATYEAILTEACNTTADRDGQIDAALNIFYRGFVAEAIASYMQDAEVMDDSGKPHRGFVSYEDMATWKATVEDPLTIRYHGVDVLKAGPWTQGPVFLQQLALLEGFELSAWDPMGAESIHVITESAKLAFADREAWYGDPAFVDVPIQALLSTEYNDQRRGLIGSEADLGELRPGSPGGRQPRLPRFTSSSDGVDGVAMALGEPTVRPTGTTPGDTCQVSVVDRWGNMASATPSGGWLQSSPTIPNLGFALGTRAQMFWIDETVPGALMPGKRPRTTLTPSLAIRDGEPFMAFGTPGGDQQDQWALVLFLRVVDWGMNIQEAIDMPMWHTSHFPSSFHPHQRRAGWLHVESRLSPATIAQLEQKGHRVVREGPWSLGRLSAVSRDRGVLRAGANPRGMQGYAVGR